jgi:cob(I)alamin adenosyltransferase
MSIATRRGDGGTTALPGGVRVSKSDARVECYGTVDELISQLGFARSICADAEVRARVKEIQRELFTVGSAIATPLEASQCAPPVTAELVAALEADVHRIEALPALANGWTLPGELPDASAFDVARTVCRRAERLATALFETARITDARILAYLNRLSDLLWLFGRLLEARAGVDASLRRDNGNGPRWSRAW